MDYGLKLDHILIYYKFKTLVQLTWPKISSHTRTKHIEIMHHFICDHVQKNDITLELWSLKIKLWIYSRSC
jgi:hypothetical protein